LSDDVQKSRRTGRPRSFDPDEVVSAAQDLFWEEGLDGTSYEQLTEATGLHRPSLHGAFDDKRGLFVAALHRYLGDSAKLLSDALSRPTLANAMKAFFETDLKLFVTPDGGRGCYALGVAAEAGRNDPEIASVEREAWRRLNVAVANRVERAPDGELPAGLDRRMTTDLILATHVTLATRSRAGESPKLLRQRAVRFVALFR